jgi:GNAT superfamily N-acetyltransferase
MTVAIRAPQPHDRPAWQALWEGYLAFYETALPAEVTASTWEALIGERDDVLGLLAVAADGTAVGLAHVVVHASTWDLRPSAYLSDLFVAPDRRGAGLGRLLIDAVLALARSRGCGEVHWITAAGNATARQLYRSVAVETDWVRYEVDPTTR